MLQSKDVRPEIAGINARKANQPYDVLHGMCTKLQSSTFAIERRGTNAAGVPMGANRMNPTFHSLLKRHQSLESFDAQTRGTEADTKYWSKVEGDEKSLLGG